MKLNYDHSFLDRLIVQDPAAFEEFYHDTVDGFFRYIKGNFSISEADAADIISTFYLKFWNYLPSIKKEYKFEALVWTIFKNLLKDFFKKSKVTSFSTIEWDQNRITESIVDESDYKDILESDYQYDIIQMAIQWLDNAYKDAIFFRFVEEKSYEEISQILCISQENVRQKISRGVKLLKSLLDDTITTNKT